MKKILTSILLVGITLPTTAQSATDQVLTEPVVIEVSFEHDKTGSTISFTVESPEDGDFFPAFWLCPAQYMDGSFTTYRVSVNQEAVGEICPSKENWQSASLKNLNSLPLLKGKNVISLTIGGNETPLVERMVLSKDFVSAEIPCENYDKYLKDAKRGRVDEAFNEKETRSSNLPLFYPGIPLKYSFWTTVDCEEGDTISVSTFSRTDHVVDIFFYGYRKNAWVYNPTSNTGLKSSSSGLGPEIGVSVKGKIGHEYPPTEMMQTLNWQDTCTVRLGGFTGDKWIVGNYL